MFVYRKGLVSGMTEHRYIILLVVLAVATVGKGTITESESTVNGNAAVTASAAITEGDLASGEIMGTKIEVTGSANGGLVAGDPSEPWDQITPLSLKIEVLGVADGVAGPHVIWDVGPEAFTAPGPGATGPSASKSFRMSSVVFPDGQNVTIKVTAKYAVTDNDVVPASTVEVSDTSLIHVPVRNRSVGWRATVGSDNQSDPQFTLETHEALHAMFSTSGYPVLNSTSLLQKSDLLSGSGALLDQSTALFGMMHGTPTRLADHDGHPTNPAQADRLMSQPGTDSPETIREVVEDPGEPLPGHSFVFLYSCHTLGSPWMAHALGVVTTGNVMIPARSHMGFTSVVTDKVIDKFKYRLELQANGGDEVEALIASLVDPKFMVQSLYFYMMQGYSVRQAINLVQGAEHTDPFDGLYVATTKVGQFYEAFAITIGNSDPNNTLYWVYLTDAERLLVPGTQYMYWYYRYE